MDALTALSVASSVIQFVDFSSKLVSKSKKLYKSSNGVLDSTIDAERLTSDLTGLLLGLRRKLPENRILSGESLLTHGSENEDNLDALCSRSIEIGEKILSKLHKLRVPVKATGRAGHQPDDEDPIETDSQPLRSTQSTKDRGIGGRAPLIFKAGRAFEGRRFSKWSSFRTALEECWSKQELDELACTLREFRSEIEFRMLLTFR